MTRNASRPLSRLLAPFLLALGLLAFLPAGRAAAVEIGEDGLYEEDWIRETFKDLPEDLAEARSEGKQLMLLVEQRGCIYCKKMHEQVFSIPQIADYIRDHFFVVQINLHGDTEIVDLDGETLTEKQATRKWGVLFTPTMIFLPKELDSPRPAHEAAVAIMPGAFGKYTTYNLLRWVAEDRWKNADEEDFQRFHARMLAEGKMPF